GVPQSTTSNSWRSTACASRISAVLSTTSARFLGVRGPRARAALRAACHAWSTSCCQRSGVGVRGSDRAGSTTVKDPPDELSVYWPLMKCVSRGNSRLKRDVDRSTEIWFVVICSCPILFLLCCAASKYRLNAYCAGCHTP